MDKGSYMNYNAPTATEETRRDFLTMLDIIRAKSERESVCIKHTIDKIYFEHDYYTKDGGKFNYREFKNNKEPWDIYCVKPSKEVNEAFIEYIAMNPRGGLYKAPEEILMEVVEDIRRSLKTYDPESVEVFLGDKDGEIFLVLAKKYEKSDYDEGQYGCWTCWNAKNQSLNHGHYGLTEKEALSILCQFAPVLKDKPVWVLFDKQEERCNEPQVFANLESTRDVVFETYVDAVLIDDGEESVNLARSFFEYVPNEALPQMAKEAGYELKQTSYEEYEKEKQKWEALEGEVWDR